MDENFEIIGDLLNPDEKESMTEAQWFDAISERVLWFLDNDKDMLLSFLYRLDIDEAKINQALMPFNEEPAHLILAGLILERQKQRLLTKNKIKVTPIKGWEY
ncbi:MAG: hypothetical protein IPL55_08780 [Saprospiraceae bacterium]|jgi:hypothetical protein|nr:hypothetical protein [Saprospiraceae bacterium]